MDCSLLDGMGDAMYCRVVYFINGGVFGRFPDTTSKISDGNLSEGAIFIYLPILVNSII